MGYKAERISAEEYAKYYTTPMTSYDRVDFARLNSDRLAEGELSLCFLSITKDDGRPMMGLIGGICGKELRAPFSAPFMLPTFSRKVVPTQMQLVEAVGALKRWLEAEGLGLEITLPPTFYCPTLVTYFAKALEMNGGQLLWTDLNHYYPTEYYTSHDSHLRRSSRHNLAVAESAGLRFEVLAPQDWERAYDVIKTNREEKGYPLRMERERVAKTIEIINSKFYVVVDENGEDIAAAQLFKVSEGIWQVIYWGHKSAWTNQRPMALLAHRVFGDMQSTGAKIVDIGPSSNEGIPDEGLAEFKTSLGCEAVGKGRWKLGVDS